MSQLMLINPRKRRSRKARSPAQRAATKRMLAANRARRGGHAKRRTAKRRHNPVGLSRVAHHTRVTRHRHKRHRRHNPIGLPRGLGGIGGMAMTSLKGAGGALLVNTALNYMPFMPDALKSGNGKYLARVGLALAIGTLGSKVMSKRLAEDMAVGAMTVALHDLLLGMASTAMPTLQLGDVGDYDSGVSAYVTSGDYGVNGVYSPTGEGVGEYVAI